MKAAWLIGRSKIPPACPYPCSVLRGPLHRSLVGPRWQSSLTVWEGSAQRLPRDGFILQIFTCLPLLTVQYSTICRRIAPKCVQGKLAWEPPPMRPHMEGKWLRNVQWSLTCIQDWSMFRIVSGGPASNTNLSNRISKLLLALLAIW